MGSRDRHSEGRISALALILAALLLAILFSSCATSKNISWVEHDVQRTDKRTDKGNNYHYTPLVGVISGAIIVFLWPQKK